MINNIIEDNKLLYKEPFVLCVSCKNEMKPKTNHIDDMLYEIIYGTVRGYNPISYVSYSCPCNNFYFRASYYDDLSIKELLLIINGCELSWTYNNKCCHLNGTKLDFDAFDFNKIMNQDLKTTKKILNKYMVLQ